MQSKVELFRGRQPSVRCPQWSDLGTGSAQGPGSELREPQANGGKKQRGQASKASPEEWRSVLRRHCWSFVLYLRKRKCCTCFKKGLLWDKDKCSLFCSLTNSQKWDYLVLMECFIKNISWDTILWARNLEYKQIYYLPKKVLLKVYIFSSVCKNVRCARFTGNSKKHQNQVFEILYQELLLKFSKCFFIIRWLFLFDLFEHINFMILIDLLISNHLCNLG